MTSTASATASADTRNAKILHSLTWGLDPQTEQVASFSAELVIDKVTNGIWLIFPSFGVPIEEPAPNGYVVAHE